MALSVILNTVYDLSFAKYFLKGRAKRSRNDHGMLRGKAMERAGHNV